MALGVAALGVAALGVAALGVAALGVAALGVAALAVGARSSATAIATFGVGARSGAIAAAVISGHHCFHDSVCCHMVGACLAKPWRNEIGDRDRGDDGPSMEFGIATRRCEYIVEAGAPWISVSFRRRRPC